VAVNFPANPIDGDTFTFSNKLYTYSASTQSWERSVSTTQVISDAETLDGFTGEYYLDYTNHTNTPSIPSDVSQLTDSNNLFFDRQYSSLDGTPTIPTDVSDLLDSNNLFFDRNYDSLTNKPDLFSGSYDDLTNKPDLALLIDVPSDISDLTDDSNIVPSDISDLTDVNNTLTSSIDDLTDVNTVSKEDGQALVWNEDLNRWQPGTVTTDETVNIDGGRADTNFNSSVLLVLDGGYA